MKRLNLTQTAIFLVFLVFIGLNSCQKDVLNPNRAIPDKHIVPEYFAQAIAEKFNGDDFFKSGSDTVRSAETVNTDLTKAPFFKSIKNSLTIPDKNKKPAFYIFNYTDGGFVFVSAEFTLQPILAYVPNGEVKRDTVPAGLVMWMEKTVENIEIVRAGLYDNSKLGIAAWKDFIRKNDIVVPQEVEVSLLSYKPNLSNSYNKKSGENNLLTPAGDEPIDCNNVIITTKGPLVPVTWGQGCTYNDLINPGVNYNCNMGCGSGRPWTGCVATAMAQVIRYWKSTPIYDYNSMPSNFGNSEVQKLMFHSGQFVDMDWGCDASGAYSNKIPNALKIYFDFASANKVNYDYLKVKNNIAKGWPALLGGCTNRTNVFLGLIYTYSDCHEWVCDGYQSVDYPCWGSYLYFHMNWGWHEVGSSTDYNGWFKFDNWNISGLNLNFKYATDAIVDIHP